MAWYTPLLTDTTTAGILVGIAMSGVVGMALGSIRLRGISLGVAGALFAGIAWDLVVWGPNRGAAAAGGHNPIIEFTRDLGLILFVYAIGLTVGPGFFERLKAQGLRWNLLAAGIVLGGCATTAATWWFLQVPGGLAVGLLAGATTNTPSLAAAGQALAGSDRAAEVLDLAAAGYALAYPPGIIGIIASLLILRPLARTGGGAPHAAATVSLPLARRTLEIVNPGAVGLTLAQLREAVDGKAIISRLARRGELLEPRPGLKTEAGDVVQGVGNPADLQRLRTICGADSGHDLMALTTATAITTRDLLVSRKRASMCRIADLAPEAVDGVTITRIRRAGIELLAGDTTELHLGDRLRVVGTAEAISRFAQVVGDSATELDHPDLIPPLIGICLGVVVGSIPLLIPGMPAPLRLGLAGGPLLIALLVASRGRLGRLDVFMPSPAIAFMKEFGILLFLACVGLLSGHAFLATLQRPDSPLLLLIGVTITMVPLLIFGLVALRGWGKPFGEVAGLLSGAMTDPPALAFAQATAGSEAPARVYATVYPLTMLLRIATAQTLMLLWTR